MEIRHWCEYFSEQRCHIIWEKWEWETDAGGFFCWGWGMNSKLSLRSYVSKKKSGNFVVNVVLRTLRMGN